MSASPESTRWRDVARRGMDCQFNTPLAIVTNRPSRSIPMGSRSARLQSPVFLTWRYLLTD